MTAYYVTSPTRRERRQVYSNRPLAVYGYIVPAGSSGYQIQVGDEFVPADAPTTGETFPSLRSAKAAILAAHGIDAV